MDLSERGAASQRHPWEVVRGEFFLRLTDEYAAAFDRVADVGAGDSWFGSRLAAERSGTQIVCWDHAYTAEELADPPTGVTRTADRPDGRFDLVFLLDVLEHLEDPVRFLDREVRPLLTRRAVIIASVPAHPRLYGPHDVALGHHRRYVPGEFLEQIETLAPVVAHGPLFISLTAPRALEIALSERRHGSEPDVGVGGWDHGAAITRLTTALLRFDTATCRAVSRFGLPVRGLSHWAVARMDGAP